jgi:uncharacterized protein HI_0930
VNKSNRIYDTVIFFSALIGIETLCYDIALSRQCVLDMMKKREGKTLSNNVMMKKKNQILVTLSVVALLGGCSEDEVQRDVYNSLDDCIADWIRPELCEPDKSQNTNNNGSVANNENNAVAGDNNATSTTTASGDEGPSIGSAIAGAAAGYMIAKAMSGFLGPSYNPNNRAVSTPTGQIIRPQGNHSVGKPVLVKGGAGSTNSKPISRGGFSSSNTSKSGGG